MRQINYHITKNTEIPFKPYLFEKILLNLVNVKETITYCPKHQRKTYIQKVKNSVRNMKVLQPL